jgi:predicted CopG family antitoxin
MQAIYMASNTVALNSKAYGVLKALKKPNQSFSDVVLENLPTQRPTTCGELLDELQRDFAGVHLLDPELTKAMLAGRGRRSNRRKR